MQGNMSTTRNYYFNLNKRFNVLMKVVPMKVVPPSAELMNQICNNENGHFFPLNFTVGPKL